MPITIEIGLEQATVTGYQWTGTDPVIVDVLEMRSEMDGPSAMCADPERFLAEMMVHDYGAEIIRIDQSRGCLGHAAPVFGNASLTESPSSVPNPLTTSAVVKRNDPDGKIYPIIFH